MNSAAPESTTTVERQQMVVDIACVGFGPAMGGFLTTLSRNSWHPDGSPRFDSAACPGVPLQVICYERADGLGFGVSGAVTRARGIRASFPDLNTTQIPMATAVRKEELVYLLDPIGASRRSFALRTGRQVYPHLSQALTPFATTRWSCRIFPASSHKHDGLLMSLGQFNQWVGEQLTASGHVQIWPSSPVSCTALRE